MAAHDASTAIDTLDGAIKRSQDTTWNSLLPEELAAVVHAFLPSTTVTLRSKAYILLSAFSQRLRSTAPSPEDGTQAICQALEPATMSRLADTEQDEAVAGLTFLSALFEVDHQAASAIFQADGVLEAVMDTLDLFPKSPEIDKAVAHLLGRASGHKACRALLARDHLQWLEWKARQTENVELRAAAAVALVKLSRGGDASEVGGTYEQPLGDEELAKLMKGMVLGARETAIGDMVEGLAYMSSNPAVKELLCGDAAFLKRLFEVVPRRKAIAAQSAEDLAASPLYGTVVIISNLCAYRPRLSPEEAQIARLKRMAKTPSRAPGQAEPPEESDPLDDDDAVRRRGRTLVKQGVVEALTSAVRATESPAVRAAAGKTLLNLIEDKENRGQVLQSGGAKALITIIQASLPPSSAVKKGKMPDIEAAAFEPVQALAKLAITASPVQVFGPNEGAIYDAIRPFSLMLIHPNANLLQRFEALMALTNLSSQSAEAATRIARADGLMNQVELLMLEDHVLVRRAATELICNMVAGSEETFNRWGGERSSASRSKLQILLALCDIDDLPTRLAASGALATLTSSPEVCDGLVDLQRERHRVLPVLGQLIDPTVMSSPPVDDDSDPDGLEELPTDPGLVLRGIVCVRNLFVGIASKGAVVQADIASEADRVGLVRALVGAVKNTPENNGSAILRPAAEALKWLLEHGVEISV